MAHYITVVDSLDIQPAAVLSTWTHNVNWPGGPGKLVVTGILASGSSAVLLMEGVQTTAVAGGLAYYVLDPAIPFPLGSTGGGPQVYDFIAPESRIQFAVRLAAGDSFFTTGIYLQECK